MATPERIAGSAYIEIHQNRLIKRDNLKGLLIWSQGRKAGLKIRRRKMADTTSEGCGSTSIPRGIRGRLSARKILRRHLIGGDFPRFHLAGKTFAHLEITIRISIPVFVNGAGKLSASFLGKLRDVYTDSSMSACQRIA